MTYSTLRKEKIPAPTSPINEPKLLTICPLISTEDSLSDHSKHDFDSTNNQPFHIGQRFPSLEAYKSSVMSYANQCKYENRYLNNTDLRANKSYNVTYHRFNCAQAEKPPKKDLQFKPLSRLYRQSLSAIVNGILTPPTQSSMVNITLLSSKCVAYISATLILARVVSIQT